MSYQWVLLLSVLMLYGVVCDRWARVMYTPATVAVYQDWAIADCWSLASWQVSCAAPALSLFFVGLSRKPPDPCAPC